MEKAGQRERSGGGRFVGLCPGRAVSLPMSLPWAPLESIHLFQAWKVPAPSMMPSI